MNALQEQWGFPFALNVARFRMSGKNNLEEFNRSIAAIRHIDQEELSKDCSQIDWDRLASQYVPSRSGHECKQRWITVDDPNINTG